jgi:hypothetical protein
LLHMAKIKGSILMLAYKLKGKQKDSIHNSQLLVLFVVFWVLSQMWTADWLWLNLPAERTN